MTVDDIRKIINSILVENGENQVGDFVFGKFEDIPIGNCETRGARS